MTGLRTADRPGGSNQRRIEPRRFPLRVSLGYQQDLLALVRDLDGRELEHRLSRISSSTDRARGGDPKHD